MKLFTRIALCLAAKFVLVAGAGAQCPTQTTVADTIHNGDGSLAEGRVVVAWQTFTAGTCAVAAGQTTVTITAGALSIMLYPNTAVMPSGTSYRATYYLKSGRVSTEYWVVPQSGTPVPLSAVRSATVPVPTVMFSQAQVTSLTSALASKVELPSPCAAGKYLLANGSATPPQVDCVDGTSGGGGSGTVTSVALTMPPMFAVSGSPVTTSGTLTAAWQNQAANLFLAGPASGAAAAPVFRALIDDDVPATITLASLTQVATRNYADLQNLPATFPPTTHAIDGGAHSASDLTPGHVLRASGSSAFGFAQIQFSEVGGALSDAQVPDSITLDSLTRVTTRNYSDLQNIPALFAPAAHALDGAAHTASGLTSGHVLKATGATNFGFVQLQFSDLGGSAAAGQLPNLESLNGTLTISKGGTGAGTAQGAINAISQLTSNGDLLFFDGSNSTRLARGANGECLKATATSLAFGSCGAGGGTTITVNGSGLTASTGDLDDATPAAPSNSINVKWQKDSGTPTNISANVPYASPLIVTGGNLTCQEASGSVAGCVSTETQTLAGAKTFNGSAVFKENLDAQKQLLLSGDLAPAQITADQNDYNPASLAGAAVLKLQTDRLRSVTGIAGGSDGRVLLLTNTGGAPLRLADEDAGSSAANRFDFASDLYLLPREAAMLAYDATAQRWRLFSHNQVQRLIDPTSRIILYDEMVSASTSGSLGWTTTTSGTSASCQIATYGVNATNKAMGVFQCDTGTTSTGRAALNIGVDKFVPVQGSMLFGFRLAVEALSTSGEEFHVRVGLHDQTGSGDATDGIYFEYDRATAGDFWRIVAAGNSTRTKTTTSLSVDTNYVWLMAFVNSAWSNVDFYARSNGATAWNYLGAIADGNIPAGAEIFGIVAKMEKTAGTTQRNLSLDSFFLFYDVVR